MAAHLRAAEQGLSSDIVALRFAVRCHKHPAIIHPLGEIVLLKIDERATYRLALDADGTRDIGDGGGVIIIDIAIGMTAGDNQSVPH